MESNKTSKESRIWRDLVCENLNLISDIFEVDCEDMGKFLCSIVVHNAILHQWDQDGFKKVLEMMYQEFIHLRQDGEGNG